MKSDTSVREPRQQRAIEKKQKIIDAGIKLLCEKGYRSTTTADIARVAGVSTGIVYNYFADKKAILIAGLYQLSDQIQAPMIASFNNLTSTTDIHQTFSTWLDKFVELHIVFQKPHQEIEALSATDSEISEIMTKFLADVASMLQATFEECGFDTAHLHEKTQFIYNIIESYCHSVAFHPDSELDYAIMKEQTLFCIEQLLANTF